MRSLLARFAGRARNAVASVPAERLSEIIRMATQDYEAGRVGPAEAGFRQVLAVDGGCFEALFSLGLVCHRSGRAHEAIDLLRAAAEVRPDHAPVHAVLALAYQATDEWSQSESAIRKAVACNPNWDAARNVMGVVLLHAGDVQGARAEFERALASNPRNLEALNNLANLRKDAGDLEGAVALYRRALDLQPDWIPALVNLGLALYQLHRLDEARSCFGAVLAREPRHADALVNFGVVSQLKGDAGAAERSYRAALAVDSRLSLAHSNLAALLLETGRLEDARAHCEAALALKPDDGDALNVSALIHKSHGDLDSAESIARKCLAQMPRHNSLRLTLGTILTAKGSLRDAEACFNDVVAQDPQSAAARYNLGTLALLRGDYLRGFELYENRFDAFRMAATDAHALLTSLGENRLWRGEPLAGRDLLIWMEQGYGDAIMMTRYLPLLHRAGAGRVTVLCEPQLHRLMAAVPGVDAVVNNLNDVERDAITLHCPVMSLPFVMRTADASIPPPTALAVPDALVRQWEARVAHLRRPAVGVCWRGSAKLRDDAVRSIRTELLHPLLATGVSLVSLQKDPGKDASADLPGGIFDPMPDCHDFMDTAALVENLDLVISVDTAVAHLAGMLGRPVWLLNRFESEWRWGLAGERSAWYPTLRIIRQEARGDWRPALERVAAELKELPH